MALMVRLLNGQHSENITVAKQLRLFAIKAVSKETLITCGKDVNFALNGAVA
jgi:hypothetical protein